MASQEDACWSCGTRWTTEDDQPPVRFTLIAGGGQPGATIEAEAPLEAIAVALPVPRLAEGP